MSMLKKVESGIQHKPLFLTIYGVPGIGKTTLAADFEKPLFADIEHGSSQLSVDRISDINTYDDLMTLIKELNADAHGYKTFVVDTLDALERMIIAKVCQDKNKKSIEDIPYGKGFVFAEGYWATIIDALRTLRGKMNVILIAHNTIEKVNDPTQAVVYDQFNIKLHKKANAIISESVDAILFCAYEVFVKSNEFGKNKAFGEGKRVMHTSAIPGHVAKNRFGLPAVLPLDYNALMSAIFQADEEKIKTVYAKLASDIPRIKDKAVKTKAAEYLEEHKNDLPSLMKMDIRVQEAIGGVA